MKGGRRRSFRRNAAPTEDDLIRQPYELPPFPKGKAFEYRGSHY